jgi:hypothetical protein
VSATVREWALIYLAILIAMILIAKYPYLLRGEAPQFVEGEFIRTLIMAGVGTGLVEVIKYRIAQLRRSTGKKRNR